MKKACQKFQKMMGTQAYLYCWAYVNLKNPLIITSISRHFSDTFLVLIARYFEEKDLKIRVIWASKSFFGQIFVVTTWLTNFFCYNIQWQGRGCRLNHKGGKPKFVGSTLNKKFVFNSVLGAFSIIWFTKAAILPFQASIMNFTHTSNQFRMKNLVHWLPKTLFFVKTLQFFDFSSFCFCLQIL